MTDAQEWADFLAARLSEDEDFARSCGADPKDDSPVRWVYDRANPEALSQFGDTPPDSVLVRSWQYRTPVQEGDWIIATHWEEDGEHIARHDPASVLADIAAKRSILELHSGDHECPSEDSNCGFWDARHIL